MSIQINGILYLTASDVVEQIDVTRQTLWRWRQEGRIPMGHRYRNRLVVFTPDEVAAIKEYANRLEPIDDSGHRQLDLFNGQKGSRGGQLK